MFIRSVDPGDRNVGTVLFELGSQLNPQLVVLERAKYGPQAFQDLLWAELEDGHIGALVVEAFRLYPKLAREQGYSEFPTAQLIGSIRFMARLHGVPVYMQGASIKTMAIAVARSKDFPLRKLQGGRIDFEGRSQHERDATAHGVYWAFRNDNSPIVQAESRVAQARHKE